MAATSPGCKYRKCGCKVRVALHRRAPHTIGTSCFASLTHRCATQVSGQECRRVSFASQQVWYYKLTQFGVWICGQALFGARSYALQGRRKISCHLSRECGPRRWSKCTVSKDSNVPKVCKTQLDTAQSGTSSVAERKGGCG